MKKLMTMALAGLIALGMAGCAKKEYSPSSAQTVRIWHTYTEGQKETLDSIVSAFNRQYEGKITVIAQDQPAEGFANAVYEAVSSGEGPDIIIDYASTASAYIGESEEDTQVVDLAAYLEKDYAKLVNAAIYAECTGFSDGKLHVLPTVTTGPVFYYNKTLFEKAGITEAPQTWEAVGEDARIIREQLGIVGFAADSLTDLYQSIIMQEGIGYIDAESQTVGFLTDKLKDWLAWYRDGVDGGYFELKPQTGDYAAGDLSQGLVAAYVGSSAGIPYLSLPEGNELACVPLPQTAEAADEWAPAWDRGMIVFKSDSEKEQAAVKFAEYFVNETNNTAWCKSVNALSPYLATQKNTEYKDYVASDLALAALAQQTGYAGVLPTPKGSDVVRNELEILVEKAATGADIDAAMADCRQKCNAALQGR